MIIKKDVDPATFVLLSNFIYGPEALLTSGEVAEILDINPAPRIRDGESWGQKKRVVNFKGDIKPGLNILSVTVEIDDQYTHDNLNLASPTHHPVPAHFVINLMKALGVPIE